MELIPEVDELRGLIRSRLRKKGVRATLIQSLVNTMRTRLTVDDDPLNEASPPLSSPLENSRGPVRTYDFVLDVDYVTQSIGEELKKVYKNSEIDGEIWEEIVTPVAQCFKSKGYEVATQSDYCYKISVSL